MDRHAIEVGVGALAIAAASGFGGAYLGAWTTARHDRTERARARRIEAADELVQAWSSALFALDTAINQLKLSHDLFPGVSRLHELINTAVTLSVRVDLLFGTVSLTSRNENAVRDHARAAVAAIERDDPEEARKQQGDAAESLAWLVNTAAEAIESTGTRRDFARRLKEVQRESGADPVLRELRKG
jgi:GTP1/Obg family GTP-binding protein